jgi:hypothetical protein
LWCSFKLWWNNSAQPDAGVVLYIGVGLDCKKDHIYITISFYRINLKLNYVSLLSG